MTIKTTAELKAKFETRKVPVYQDFVDLVESILHAQLGNFPDPLPAVSGKNLKDIGDALPDPLPARDGKNLYNINPQEYNIPSGITPSYASANTFVVTGDYTSGAATVAKRIFLVGRRLRLTIAGSYTYTDVLSASYNAGSDITTVTTANNMPGNQLTACAVGILTPVAYGGLVGTAAVANLATMPAITLSAAALNEARSNIAQHATTMDFWAAAVGNVLDGTGSALTITAIANAPQAGASRDFYPIVGTILTQGATFDIDGAVNRTAAAGEVWTFVAKSVNTYRVFVRKADGTAVVVSTAPVFGRVVRTAGNITTTSTTFVDVTGATVTFTTGAFPVAYGFVGSGSNNTLQAFQYFDVDIDGTRQSGAAAGFLALQAVDANDLDKNASFTGQSVALTAAAHTVKMQHRVSAGTGSIRSVSPATIFWAHEIR